MSRPSGTAARSTNRIAPRHPRSIAVGTESPPMDEEPPLLLDAPMAGGRRRFTMDEWDLYTKTTSESEGFDTMDIDPNVIFEFGLHKLILEEEQPDLFAEFKEDLQAALDQHSYDFGTGFKVVKVLKANALMQGGEGVDFYITFQAKNEGIVQNFQAIIRHFFERTVLSLRLEAKKSQLLQGSDKEGRLDSSIPNKSKCSSGSVASATQANALPGL